LKKAARGSFVIEASEEVLEQLKENTDGKSNDLSTAKRQHAILPELLLTTEPLSLAHLMESYRISNTTFYADIKQLEE
ncbi:BglG family transcription antiterminator, partial [Enterococcus faecium]